MKTLKLLFYSVLISLTTLTSCTNNDVDDLPNPQESAAMQTTLTELRTLYNEDGTINSDVNPTGNLLFDFCFEFVFPIELIYNNGATVTINSLEELIEVLINATDELYIVGIEFPFNVEIYNPETNEVEIITIANESEFAALLASCLFGDPCDCDDGYEPVCVEIQENNQIIIITFPNACFAECEGFTEDQYFECDDNGCGCDGEYEPVCVETPNGGIIEFDNECEALCEGYTPNDFVECENDGNCDISELEVEIGECNDDGTYSLTINFEYENTGNQQHFDLYVRNGVLLGYYALADLPLTINHFELSGLDHDYIKVCINDNPDCCEELEWEAPDCNNNGGDCNISNLEVEVGECNPAGTYALTIDFDYENTDGQQYFDLYVRDGVFLGYYELADLPLTIENFELSGFDHDYIKVCINDNADCCEELEWEAPDCDNNNECSISNLDIEVGECSNNTESAYTLTIDFDYDQGCEQAQIFNLFVREDVFIGTYSLFSLPLTIENFELSGYEFDYLKVCINNFPDSCADIEWLAPECD